MRHFYQEMHKKTRPQMDLVSIFEVTAPPAQLTLARLRKRTSGRPA